MQYTRSGFPRHAQRTRGWRAKPNSASTRWTWRETTFFSDRERAALDGTEAVTRVADVHVPDEVYERVRTGFTEPDVAALTFAGLAINGGTGAAAGPLVSAAMQS